MDKSARLAFLRPQIQSPPPHACKPSYSGGSGGSFSSIERSFSKDFGKLIGPRDHFPEPLQNIELVPCIDNWNLVNIQITVAIS
jgi:hypothetical protein